MKEAPSDAKSRHRGSASGEKGEKGEGVSELNINRQPASANRCDRLADIYGRQEVLYFGWVCSGIYHTTDQNHNLTPSLQLLAGHVCEQLARVSVALKDERLCTRVNTGRQSGEYHASCISIDCIQR